MGDPSEWDDYNSDGTYSYPPEPVCAEQVVAFWRRCPIPDAVLAQIQRAHPDVRRVLVSRRVEELHPASRPKERIFGTESKAAAAGWDAARQSAIAEAEALFPPAPMPAAQTRTIVRAMRATMQAGDSSFNDSEILKVTSQPSGLSWNGRDLTWGNVCAYYGHRAFADWVWNDPAVTGPAKLDEMSRSINERLDQLNAAVIAIKDGQDADFLTRGKSQRQAERALRDAGFTKG